VKLSGHARKALPLSAFALSGRKFPIEDKPHARAALSRAAHKGGKTEATVRRKVHARYPGIKIKGR
jgi:hypothetical protein